MKKLLFAAALAAFVALTAQAELVETTIEYKDDDTVLEGVLIHSDDVKGPRPTVLVFHQWGGISEHELSHARQLTELGYAAFVADVYGKGVRPETTEARSAEAARYRGERDLFRKRVLASLDEARRHTDVVDTTKVAAIGYCFGGTAVLELARAGADISGVVSFHGALSSPRPGDAAQIKCPVLVLHGADDPYVPFDEVMGFQDEMRGGKVDWQMVSYGNAVHAFTDKGAGSDNSKGAAYNEKAARLSWDAMKAFLTEHFSR